MALENVRKNENVPVPTDLELVGRFRETGNQAALATLLKRYSGYIMAFGYKHIREDENIRDFVQDLYVRLAEKLQQSEVEHFKSWLYRVMQNMFLDTKRREKLHQVFEEQAERGTQHSNVAKEIERGIDRRVWEAALEKLPEDEQLAVRLVYLKELSYQEIMAETGWTFNQVRGFRQRGIARLKTLLGSSYG